MSNFGSKYPNFNELSAYGFQLGVPGAVAPRAWIGNNMAQLAHDAALVSTPNTTVPAELTAYYDPAIIDVLTRPRRAREIFSEVRKGEWSNTHAKFRVNELTGSTQPYADFGQAGVSGVNYNYITREQYVFQTLIQYGDLEEAVSAAARIQLAADKQRAAAHVLDVDSNLFYLLGVAGKEIYGLLNDPSLPAAIAPLPTGAGNSALWQDKNTLQIYNDVLHLFERLCGQSDGWIDADSELALVISPAASVALGKATEHNVCVLDMLRKYFSQLKLVTLPELADDQSGDGLLLIATEIGGNPSAELAFSDKLRTGRVVPDVSSFRQKWAAGTYGAIIYYPFAFAQMRGIR